MADEKKAKVIPKELGSSGVYNNNAEIYFAESVRDLQFPHSLVTYDKMAMDGTIASALNAVKIIANRVPIYIESYDQTNKHKKRAEFVEQCFNDMVDGETLATTIQKALTFNQYGFSILEKVFRKRRFKYGSKYDDNKIGIKYLPLRRQHSITEFKWDDDYRRFIGVYQNATTASKGTWEYNSDLGRLNLKMSGNRKGDIFIPRDRFLLFKVDQSTDLPQSVSPLYNCYNGWRELQNYKDLENISASKNMNGILLGRIPEPYLAEDADEEMKKAGQKFIDGLTKVGRNEQACITLPSTRTDDQTGSLEWDVTTLSSSSSHQTAVSATVQRIQNELLQLMFADALRSGDGANEQAKNRKSLLHTLVEIRIKEILRVINTDLIPELCRLNGWTDNKFPQYRYGEIEEMDIAVFAKAIQQVKATSMLPITPEVINRILEVLGFTYRVPSDMSKEDLKELLGVDDDMQSRSGDGMASKTGGLNGTSNSVSKKDNATDNLDNK